jgi:hypothetical protein
MVNILKREPFELTAASSWGILSAILTQYEHQVAVKYNPRYRKEVSFNGFSSVELRLCTGPNVFNQSSILIDDGADIILKFDLMTDCPLCSTLSLTQTVSSFKATNTSNSIS